MQTSLMARALALGASLLFTQLAGAAGIVVAQVGPMSGLEANQGRAYGIGLQLALAAAGKAGPHTFTVVRKDDGGRPDDTVALTKQVLAESRPLVLSGYFGARNLTDVLAAGLLEKEKIAIVGYRASEVHAETPFMYNVRAGLREEVAKIIEHLSTVGITRLGLFYEDGPGAAPLLAVVDEVTRRTGATVTAKASYPAGTAKVAPAIESMLAANVQAIVMLGTGSAAANFIEQYRVSGGTAQLFAQSAVDVELLAKRVGEDTMKGISITQVVPSPYKMSVRVAKEFADAVAATPNPEMPVSYAMMEGYIAGKVIAEAARRMGPRASREGFIAAMDAMDAYDMGGYRVAYKPGARGGSRFVEMSIISATGRIRQ